jgi:K+-transporting ATPase ATPase C chain
MKETTAIHAAPVTEGVLCPALVLFVLLTVVTGVLYPLVVTGIAQTAFPDAASGSLITRGETVVGSRLIGQAFSDPGYFWSRLSATGPVPYNGGASSGANLGPLNPALADAVQARIDALDAADPGNNSGNNSGNNALVPIDLVTASSSGLDPHISVAAANYQSARIARIRGLSQAQVQELIDANTQGVWLGWLGEPRVNVLELNLALDMAAPR